MKRKCYLCGRRCWFRPASFRLWGDKKAAHAACLRALITAGKLDVK